MSYQAESQSTINEVLLLIAVLQRIPKNRWVSSTEIRKASCRGHRFDAPSSSALFGCSSGVRSFSY